MRYLAVLFLVVSASAAASAERQLTGDEIGALLPTIAATTETTRQTFASDGNTDFIDTSRTRTGRWRVQGDFYCSMWPPSDAWRCYAVHLEKGAGGKPDSIIWTDAELGDRTVNTIVPTAQ